MSEENYAAILHGPFDLKIQKWPMPEIKDDEVLVRIECVGICGSDVKFYSTGKCGFDVISEPLVIGHEGAGVVHKVGSKVTTLKRGDRVAIEPTQPCRVCDYCKAGRYNLCPKPGYCSSLGTPGNLCRYYKHVADFCHKIPENLSMDEAAAVQPLAIAIHACNRAQIKLGSKVAIFGAGPVGVLCAMSAKAMGASSILITDIVESRLETAKGLGADFTLCTKKDDTDEQTVAAIIEMLGARPDITIDACAYVSVQRVAMKVTVSGGRVLVVGIGEENATVPLSPTLLREVDLIGSFRFNNTYPAALSAVSSGAINLKSFITHHFPLEKATEALEVARTGAGMKVIINVQS